MKNKFKCQTCKGYGVKKCPYGAIPDTTECFIEYSDKCEGECNYVCPDCNGSGYVAACVECEECHGCGFDVENHHCGDCKQGPSEQTCIEKYDTLICPICLVCKGYCHRPLTSAELEKSFNGYQMANIDVYFHYMSEWAKNDTAFFNNKPVTIRPWRGDEG